MAGPSGRPLQGAGAEVTIGAWVFDAACLLGVALIIWAIWDTLGDL